MIQGRLGYNRENDRFGILSRNMKIRNLRNYYYSVKEILRKRHISLKFLTQIY